MDAMNKTVSMNMKRLRETKKLSMDELVRLSGVSKSMIAQIERGEGNPTISTLWKIANGMKVPFDALTCREKLDFEIVRTHDLEPFFEDNGRVKNYTVFPDDENRKFAIYHLELAKGAYWNSEPHLRGTAEFISIFAGQLTLRCGEQEHSLQQGDHIRFKADVAHTYHNHGDSKTLLHMVIYNP